jgi:hypothetical protein
MSPDPLLILFKRAFAISSSPEEATAVGAGFALAAGAASVATCGSLAIEVLTNNIDSANAAKSVVLVCLFITILTALIIIVFIFKLLPQQ